MGGVTAATPPGGRPMTTTVSVDPSVSRTPLPLDASDLATICVLCSHNCGVRVDVAGGRITAVRADETNPITTGYICNKGFSIPSYVNHPERVAHPLRRTADGGFEPIGWDVAIAEIAARLGEIRSRHSPRAIGLVGIGGQGNHMDAPYGLGFLRALGSRRWFNAFAQEKTQHCLMDQWMFDASPATYFHADQRNARFLLVLGTNPRISNRGHNATESFKRFVEDPQHTLVVVDPRETETTRGAHRHLRVRPGTDAYLLLALAATIVRRGLVDETYVAEKTHDFAKLAGALAAVDVDEMAQRCGLEPVAIVETATRFAEAESAAIFYDLGVEQTPFSTLISYLIRVLLSLTGNVGRPGGNVFFETLLAPEIYARLGEAMNLFGPVPAALPELAAGAGEPEGAMRFVAAAQELAATDAIGKERLLFWTYRTLGPHLPSPVLAAIWLQSHLNAMLRMPNVVRALGPDWDGKSPFEVGAEVFRRILDHPEGVEIARIAEDTNLEDHVGFEDGRIRLAPEPMLAEIERALASPPVSDAGFPFVLAAGLRTRWTANTIQRDPGWRKGRGPHCALNLSPGDAEQLGVRDGGRVRVGTRRGALTLPAQIDPKLLRGHVWMPNGFGMVHDGMLDGANQNELTDVADRDPFTGIPHHRYVRCNLERCADGDRDRQQDRTAPIRF